MNERVVASLRRSGLQITTDSSADSKQSTKPESGRNPVYMVRYSDSAEPLKCFSKVFNQAPNPTSGFCAVMVCSDADKACPIVQGCAKRIAIRYNDPKSSDGSPAEAATYDERSQQICREMLFAMSHL